MDILLVKWAHILSSTVLFGTGIGSAFYMFMANRRKEISGMVFATRHVVIADWLFTTPSVIIQLVTGVWLAHTAGYGFAEGWIQWAIALYFFAGFCWLPVVWMQIKMRDMAKAALEAGAAVPERYWTLDRAWTALGCLAFPAVVFVFYLMVLKPDLPSLFTLFLR
jgi:uncharacterized membrane protein